jgi:hypothetical protein
MNSSQNLNHLLLREELHNKQNSVENGPSVNVNICGSKEIKEGKIIQSLDKNIRYTL